MDPAGKKETILQFALKQPEKGNLGVPRTPGRYWRNAGKHYLVNYELKPEIAMDGD
jgi:hypothetical protein